MVKFLIGGSPCTYWTVAKREGRETEPSGIGWELFKNYLIAKEKFQPDFFLYENNKSASEAIKNQIKIELNVNDGTLFGKGDGRYIEINSALVSAQTRKRFYVHNFGDILQPDDRGIFVRDIVQPRKDKERYRYTERAKKIKGKNAIYKLKKSLTTLDEKSKCLTCGQKATNAGATTILYPDGEMYIVSPTECERLQTLPDGYTRVVCDTARYKAIGNGWTAEVIIYLLSHALIGIPKDEEIVVLSMYDGIATGRYCFDKLGYKNIRYFAYEIDKYAIEIAQSNFPDIVQCGDAFSVREAGWNIPFEKIERGKQRA